MDGALTVWEHARQFLPLHYVSEPEVHGRLLNGSAHLWVNEDSACVTEVTSANTYRIWIAGGRLKSMLPVLKDVEAAAVAFGCSGVELEGRDGWLRVLSPLGYVHDGQRLIKSWQ